MAEPTPTDTPDIAVFRESVRAVFAEMEQTLVEKRLSYGAANLTRRGTAGIVIRAEDKLERLWTMAIAGAQTTATRETREDAWSDLMGYSVLGLLFERGEKV